MNNSRQISSPANQRGSVLLISMMLLIVLTLLTFSVSDSVLVQGKMTANSRDDLLAFEVAEAAAKEAEQNVVDFDYTVDGGDNGHYDGECDEDDAGCYILGVGDLYDEETWKKSTTALRKLSCGNGDPDCQVGGEYIVVRMGTVDVSVSRGQDPLAPTSGYESQSEGATGDVFKYKIIARGTGINPENRKVIVTYYAAAEM